MTTGHPPSFTVDGVFDRFVPARSTSPAEALQLRLILGGALLGCIVSLASLVLSLAQGQASSAAAIGAFGGGCLGLVVGVRLGARLRSLRISALALVSAFLVIASLQTVDLQWQQFKWLALLPMLSLFLDEPATNRRGFRGRVAALWSGTALAAALAFFIVAANRAGWTFGMQTDTAGWASLTASLVDEFLFVGSIAGLLTIHDVALRKSEVELDMLRSMLSVCAWCRRIHDDEEGWVQMERYMTRHRGASLTHGICPDCEAKTMAEIERRR
ncbi:MAG: hypothetical protein U0Q55_20200 [Vicinamibacterales bacterium]